MNKPNTLRVFSEVFDIWGRSINNIPLKDECDMIKFFVDCIVKKSLYFVTLKCVKHNEIVSTDYYVNIMQKFWDYGNIFSLTYELDKQNRLHAHFIFQMSSYMRIYDHIPKFCHCKFKKVFYIQGLLNYLNKDVHNNYVQAQLLDAHHYIHHYGFGEDDDVVKNNTPIST